MNRHRADQGHYRFQTNVVQIQSSEARPKQALLLAHPAMFAQPDASVVIAGLARVSQWMFIALLAILPVFRLRPIAKSDSIIPRLAPFVAIVLSPMFLLLQRAPSNL